MTITTEEERWWLWRPRADSKYVGRLVPRKDARAKASGTHLYLSDMKLPGMLYARPLRSPYANVFVKRIDKSNAEKVPDIIAVITVDDPEWKDKWPLLTFHPGYAPPGDDYFMGSKHRIWRIRYIMDKAWWYGKPVGAVVVGRTDEAVYEALRLLAKDTEWEELPFCLDWEESEKLGYPIIPDWKNYSPDAEGNNEYPPATIEFGNVEEGFKEADHIIEFSLKWEEPNTWALPEAAIGVAQWAGNHLKVWTNTQYSNALRFQIADMYGIPESAIDIETPWSGAQFGGYNHIRNMAALMAVLLSRKFQRPVKFIDEYYIWEGCEHVLGTYKFKVGFKKDGTITAVRIDTVGVAPGFSGVALHRSFMESTKIRNLLYNAKYPLINMGPRQCSKEGAPFCLMRYMVINRVAAELGMDPTEVALKNDGCEGHDIEWIYDNIAKKQGFDTSRWSLKECIEIGKKVIGWDEKWHPPGTKKLPNGKYHGIGFGCTQAWTHSTRRAKTLGGSYSIPIRVYLSLASDGTVRIVAHRPDTGVGHDSSYSIIAADEIGMRYEDVYMDFSYAKDFCLWEIAGSAGTSINTPLIAVGARKLKRKILEAALELQEFKGKTYEDLDIKDSMIFEKGNPDNKVPVAEVARGRGILVSVSTSDLKYPPWPQPNMVRQVIFAEVEVDPETGGIEVTNIVRIYDCGKVINLGAVRGQLYPYWGIGRCLTEAVYFDPLTGIPLNDNFTFYPILLANDIKNIDIEFVETNLAYGVYGSCGCSEAGAAAATPILIPAVYNAIGKWINPPITPDKILKALGKA